MIRQNVVLRAPWIASNGYGAIYVAASATGVEIADNIVQDRHQGGHRPHQLHLRADRQRSSTIPAAEAIAVLAKAKGSATLTGNLVENLVPGQPALKNDSPATFTVTATANAGVLGPALGAVLEDRLDPAAGVELGTDALDVGADRFQRDLQLVGDLLVDVPAESSLSTSSSRGESFSASSARAGGFPA